MFFGFLISFFARPFHIVEDDGGSGGGFGGDGGCGADGAADAMGRNSGGVKLAQTSKSAPNWRRNTSENERNKTNTGNKITVPM